MGFFFFFFGNRFVPVALADSYGGYTLAPPPPLSLSLPLPGGGGGGGGGGLHPAAPLAAGSGINPVDLSYYLHPLNHAHYQRYPPLSSPLHRYLPPGSDWRRIAQRSGDIAASGSMHAERSHPLPLAAAEASQRSSAGEAGGAGGGGGGGGGGAEVDHVNRCVANNCVCAGTASSSPSCPKNVQAGPLTGINGYFQLQHRLVHLLADFSGSKLIGNWLSNWKFLSIFVFKVRILMNFDD